MDYVKVIVEIADKIIKVIKREVLGSPPTAKRRVKEGNNRDEKNSK